jgi:uncharacterized Zn-finger protein
MQSPNPPPDSSRPTTSSSEQFPNESSQQPHPPVVEASRALNELATTAGQAGSVIYNNNEEPEPEQDPQVPTHPDITANPQPLLQNPLPVYQGPLVASYQPDSLSTPVDPNSIPPLFRDNPGAFAMCVSWIQQQGQTYHAPSEPQAVNLAQSSPPPPSRPQPGREYKSHVCKVCSRSFARPSALTTHIRTHTGERPYGCSLLGCGKTFNVKSNCTRHEDTKHGIIKRSKQTSRTPAGGDENTPDSLELFVRITRQPSY